MKQQLIVLLVAALAIFVVATLTGYVEEAENMQDMEELLSQEETLTEDQIRNIDQNIVDEYYNKNLVEPSTTNSTTGYNLTVIVNDVIQ